MPLRSLTTNETIPSFPETVDEFLRLSGQYINDITKDKILIYQSLAAAVVEILRALSASTDGTVEMKRSRLRLQCGLREI